MGDEDKLAPLSGPGVSGNEPLAGREERQVLLPEFDATGQRADEPLDLAEEGPFDIALDLRGVVEKPEYQTIDAANLLAAVRAIVREELRAALKETFQR